MLIERSEALEPLERLLSLTSPIPNRASNPKFRRRDRTRDRPHNSGRKRVQDYQQFPAAQRDGAGESGKDRHAYLNIFGYRQAAGYFGDPWQLSDEIVENRETA